MPKPKRGGQRGITPSAPAAPAQPQKQPTWEDTVLGEKSATPRTAEEAISVTNPNFSTGESKWRRNCQRCVWAFEAQMRGYDVEAKERILDGTDKLPYNNTATGWPSLAKGMTPTQMPSRNTAKKMAEQMADWGDGSRAIVRVIWQGGHGGHVFSAIQRNGETHYFDPQTGKNVDISTYLGQAIKKYTQLWRVDDKEFNQNIELAVKKRGT